MGARNRKACKRGGADFTTLDPAAEAVGLYDSSATLLQRALAEKRALLGDHDLAVAQAADELGRVPGSAPEPRAQRTASSITTGPSVAGRRNAAEIRARKA
jgi:hypothetical protein